MKLLKEKVMPVVIALLLVSQGNVFAWEEINCSAWAEDEIKEAINYSIVTDESLLNDCTISITREEFVELAINLCEIAMNRKFSEPTMNPFSDTENISIIKAYNSGIIEGVGSGLFAPYNSITREEAAVIVYNVVELIDVNLTINIDLNPDFRIETSDKDRVSLWAVNQVNYVAYREIMVGYGDKFDPKNEISIEEAILIIKRSYIDTAKMLEEYSKAGYVTAEYEAKSEEEINQMRKEIFDLTNKERMKVGLSLFKEEELFSEVAQIKSKDMSDSDYYGHISPTYGATFNIMESMGINYRYAAENIGKGQTSAIEVVAEWMESEGHRENILSEEFEYLGVGIAENSAGDLIFTQTFYDPMELEVKF